jgi:hypothetical protein
MAVSRVTYCTREDIKSALDVKETARNNDQLDRAVESASDSIDGLMNRVFFTTDTTCYFDWPNFQLAYPWRIWFDQAELADITVNVPVVTSGGHTIAAASIFWGHPNYSPPYTYMELDRSTSATFGQGNTPQRDVHITGTFGFDVATRAGGALAAAISSTTATTCTVTDGSQVGIGNSLLVGTERLLVTGRANTTTGQTQQGTGVSTASSADNVLAVTDGTTFFAGEVVTLDAERMLIYDVTGNNLTVKRAWDGTVLATHSGATVYASRLLTVARGAQGTTAAAHSNGAAVAVHLVPPLIRELAVAYASATLISESAGWARQWGEGSGSAQNIGRSVKEIEAEALRAYGRRARTRVI